tara:strand:+ start:358 stop:519 length:162 start_codon:yes stop_codon:yes gene_type:complete
MAGNNEEAVARAQSEAANAQGVQKHHKSTLTYISECIFTHYFLDILNNSCDSG